MNLDQFQQDGKFLMLALDHRASIRKLINPANPDSVSDDEIIQLKSEIIKSVESQCSGILVDELFGLKAYPQKSKPFLLPVEKSGYLEKDGERINQLEYSVKDVIKLGASGVKLLLYFNPSLGSSTTQLEIAKKVLDECQEVDCPFFLELVTYGLDNQDDNSGDNNLVVGSVSFFIEHEVLPDVFKLEYPNSLKNCQEITKIAGNTPWILLTKGNKFDVFSSNLQEAIRGGAKGFLAGRALWQELCEMEGEQRQEFLAKTLPQRFRDIVQISKS